jgi:hypothetical protein
MDGLDRVRASAAMRLATERNDGAGCPRNCR